MAESSKHIIIVAGEASGDIHAAQLVTGLKSLDSSLRFSGLGGQLMKKAGVELYEDLTQWAVVGFMEVLKHYAQFKKCFDHVLKRIETLSPAAVILVDYPGFNLRLAKAIKQRAPKTKIIYYISPQIWAWKQNRVHDIKKYVDRMLVLFPFEKDFYVRFGINASFVGHPLLDEITVKEEKPDYLLKQGLDKDALTIGMIPGSREKEVRSLLPVMVKTAKKLKTKYTNIQFVLIQATTISSELIKHSLNGFKLTVIKENRFDALNACDLCMVASGTATLETAILKKPMIVIYKTSFLTWLLARLFVKIPHISLVNVVAQKRVVPECIQYKARPEIISGEIEKILANKRYYQDIKENLRQVKESLGEKGSSLRAAREIINSL